MRIGIIIQARMGSTRLSGKVMKSIKNKTILNHVIDRLEACEVDELIIATTTGLNDDRIEEEAIACGVKVFRGSEDDVLSRYYFAAKENALDTIIRITSDCPLIDSHIVNEMIMVFKTGRYDIVTNSGPDVSKRTFPRGLDVEIFSMSLLEEAFENANENYQREHVTPYLYENRFNIYHFLNDKDLSYHRWTLDTEDDWLLVESIYDRLYLGKHNFYMNDILEVFENEPNLIDLNSHVEQKKVK